MGGDGIEKDANAHGFQFAFEQGGRGGIELLNHQVRSHLDDSNFQAVAEQSARRLQTEQAAADYHCPITILGIGADARAIVDGSKNKNALLLGPLHGWNKGARAGGQHQPVVRLLDFAGAANDHLAPAIDSLGLDPAMNVNVSLFIPVEGIDPELVRVLKTAPNGR